MNREFIWGIILLAVLVAACASTAPQVSSKSVPVKSIPPSQKTEIPQSAACLDCHESYKVNHHPVDLVPNNPSRIPFRLYDGKITCLTCHLEDINGPDHTSMARSKVEGPDICFKCHSGEEYADIDPHIMLESDGRVVQVKGGPVCLVCHTVRPNAEVDRTKDVKFKADVAFLCWRCHGIMANAMLLNAHFQIEPSASMLSYMRGKEYELAVTIPLVPRQRITCSTCHNPHQEGVIVYLPSAKGADSKNRLRLPHKTLCLVCHQF